MGLGSCCGGFGGFAGPVQGFPWMWSVILFVQFGFGGGVLISVGFDWVRGGGGRVVGGLWWRFLQGRAVVPVSCCEGIDGFEGAERGFP